MKEIRRIARNKIVQVNAYLEQKGKKRYFAAYPEWKELCFHQEEVCQIEGKKKNQFYSQIVFLYTAFYVDNRLIGYLCGDRNVDRRLLWIVELFLPERKLGPIFIILCLKRLWIWSSVCKCSNDL